MDNCLDDEDLLLLVAKAADLSVLEKDRVANLRNGGFIESPATQERDDSKLALSIWGLFRVLKYVCEATEGNVSIETLDKVALAQSERLLIFKKWASFEKNRTKAKLIELIRGYFLLQTSNIFCHPIYNHIDRLSNFGLKKMTPQELEATELKDFYNYIFLVYDFLKDDEQWLKGLAADDELRQFALRQFQAYRKVYTTPLRELDHKAYFLKDSLPL